MSTLRLPGLLTGIDTNTLISQLMAIERRTLTMYQQRISLWEERKSALSSVETKLSTLRSSVRALSDADELRAFSTASSDTDILTAEASYNAFEGNHTVVINQLANAERWVHTNGLEYAEDYVGAGTFIYSYNHQETIITTTGETTLEDLVGLINNDPENPGVTASLLHYNDAYHLVLNGNDAGSDYAISINASSTEVWQADSAFTVDSDNATLSTKITALDQFDFNGDSGLSGGEQIQITGADHNGNAIAQVNLSVTDNTKVSHLIAEINDAFYGIAKATFENGEIILTDKAAGTSNLSIALTYDQGLGNTMLNGLGMSVSVEGGGAEANLENFAVTDFTQTQAAQNSLLQVDGYPSGSAVPEVQTMTPSPLPNSGTYTLTYEGQTTAAIDYNADTGTIQAALEALSTVNAGDVTVGGGANGLADGAITFTFSDTLGDVSMISIDDGNLMPGTINVTVEETTKGVPAWISRSSNTVDDVIHGVTLHLHDTGTVEVNLTRDIESVKDKLSSMVDAYNLAVHYIKENSGYDKTTETAGVLMADYVISTIRSQLNMPLVDQTSGFVEDIDTFLMPGQIGLELDRDGLLNLDTNVFDEAIAEDYMGVLAIIGADKTGSSDSNTIEFYGASSKYTRAGTYDVQVQVTGGVIEWAKIKLSTESTYRDATFEGNIVTGDSTFDDNGDPVYAENGLQLSIDLSEDGPYTATVRVKQGFAGAMEDFLDRMLKASTGSIQIDQEHVDDQIELLQDKIETEEYRLEKREERLIARFAALERTLALIQSQLSALGFGTA